MDTIDADILALWDRYFLPEKKRTHVSLVARVAVFIAQRLNTLYPDILINIDCLKKASLLHDIDNGISFLPGEVHPDAAVRILHIEGLHDVASIVKTHSLYAILDAGILPQKWEEKVLYLADKMVKYEIITVDQRFNLWREEGLPQPALQKLDACYPRVKALEQEIFARIHMSPQQVALLLS